MNLQGRELLRYGIFESTLTKTYIKKRNDNMVRNAEELKGIKEGLEEALNFM